MQDLDDFLKQKTDRELFKILKGNYSYNQKLLAESVLKERKFEFDNLEKYKHVWELEKLENETKEERDNIFSWFKNWAFGFDVYTVFPVILLLSIIFVFGNLIFQLLNLIERTIIESIIVLCSLIVLEFILLYVYKTRKKKIERRTTRIVELKKILNEEF